jgi:hypothetical protein
MGSGGVAWGDETGTASKMMWVSKPAIFLNTVPAVPSSLIAHPALADWPRCRVPIVIVWLAAPVLAGLFGWVHDPSRTQKVDIRSIRPAV